MRRDLPWDLIWSFRHISQHLSILFFAGRTQKKDLCKDTSFHLPTRTFEDKHHFRLDSDFHHSWILLTCRPCELRPSLSVWQFPSRNLDAGRDPGLGAFLLAAAGVVNPVAAGVVMGRASVVISEIRWHIHSYIVLIIVRTMSCLMEILMKMQVDIHRMIHEIFQHFQHFFVLQICAFWCILLHILAHLVTFCTFWLRMTCWLQAAAGCTLHPIASALYRTDPDKPSVMRKWESLEIQSTPRTRKHLQQKKKQILLPSYLQKYTHWNG